jgi:GWxTD domain-containing protein
MRGLTIIAVVALAGAALPAAAQAPDMGAPPSMGGIRFAADVTAGPVAPGEQGTVLINYAVAYDELLFLRHEEGYRARYDVTAVLYDRHGKQVAGDSWRRTIDVDDYAETNSRRLAARETLRLNVPAGTYRLRLEIASIGTRAAGSIEMQVEVPTLDPEELTLGTLVFEREARPAAGDTTVVQNPNREYGEGSPVVYLAIPVYGDTGRQYVLAVSVETPDGLVEKTVSDTVRQTSFLTEHVSTFGVLDLEVGSYFAHVLLKSLDGKTKSQRRSRFVVVTSPKSWGQDFGKMIEQISYVASRDELDRLLDAAPEDREAAWAEFWRGRDPDPTTERNEFRDEFMRRLGYANTRFSSVVEGWQTDMGRIYIQYGEPDDVESVPIGKMLNAWETWYYYDQHTKYTFVDQEGFGDYKLVEVSRI